MPLKIKILKFINNIYVFGFVFLVSLNSYSQEIIEDSTADSIDALDLVAVDSLQQRVKIDGVAAVIGDFVILDSDIDKQFMQLEAGGISTDDITRCQLFGKLLEDKLYIHHAIQDSIEVNDAEILSNVDQQLAGFAEQIGSMDKLVAYYKKSSEQELRDEMFELNKNGQMATMMQQSVIQDLEVTPEEVRQFFNKIALDERPMFGTELRIAQIVVVPETTQLEVGVSLFLSGEKGA